MFGTNGQVAAPSQTPDTGCESNDASCPLDEGYKSNPLYKAAAQFGLDFDIEEDTSVAVPPDSIALKAVWQDGTWKPLATVTKEQAATFYHPVVVIQTFLGRNAEGLKDWTPVAGGTCSENGCHFFICAEVKDQAVGGYMVATWNYDGCPNAYRRFGTLNKVTDGESLINAMEAIPQDKAHIWIDAHFTDVLERNNRLNQITQRINDIFGN